MRTSIVFIVAVVAILGALPAGAQPGSVAPTAPPIAQTPAQADLAPLVAPRVAYLNDVGTRKIAARTGKPRRDIQVLTQYGVSYFGWPKNVKPVAFEIEFFGGGAVAVRASGYSPARKADYAAAFDAVLPEAVRQAEILKARALRPK